MWGIDCELLSPQQCSEKCPLIETNDILGGIWIEKDGVAHPKLICNALINEATRLGVVVIEKCRVNDISQKYDFVSAVKTDHGRIDCEYFVNCAGFWAHSIGQLSKPIVKIPLQAAEHYFLHTKPIENIDPMMPVIRDLDANIYIREVDGRILAGGFSRRTKPAFQNVTIPCTVTF